MGDVQDLQESRIALVLVTAWGSWESLNGTVVSQPSVVGSKDLGIEDAVTAPVVEGVTDAAVVEALAGAVCSRGDDAVTFASLEDAGVKVVLRHGSPARDRAA